MGELIAFPRTGSTISSPSRKAFFGVTDPEQIAEPAAKIYEVFNGLMAERRQQPQDDLMSALLAAEVDGERLTEDELLGFCFLLLVAGNDTTTSLLGSGALLLAQHPDQRETLVANRGLLRDAIEEMLRYESPTQVIPRVARDDYEIHGVRVPPVPACNSLSAPRTATSASSPMRTASTSGARCGAAWPSASGCTSASARRSHVSKPALLSTRYSTRCRTTR